MVTEKKRITTEELLKEAKESELNESYTVLEKNSNYRVGIGARLDASGQPSFFIEVLVYLCSAPPNTELQGLERRLMFAKELQSRGYSFNCQDGNILCEITTSAKEMTPERRAVISLANRIFND